MIGVPAMVSQQSFSSQFAQGQSGSSFDVDRAARLTLSKERWVCWMIASGLAARRPLFT
jgi:hypothetical protein